VIAALILTKAAPDLAQILFSISFVAFVGATTWDLIVLLGLLIDENRRRRGLRPMHVGVDYGAGEDVWFDTTPSQEPYRSSDHRRPLARGEPAAAARQVGADFAPELAVAIGVVTLVVAARSCRLGYARTACSALRSAMSSWTFVHRMSGCPTVDELKVERVLDAGFNPRDPWGSAYALRHVDDDFVCISPGPDRQLGTADDVVVSANDTDVRTRPHVGFLRSP
jgi:hypothetical protein